MDFANTLGLSVTPEINRKARQWAHRYWASSECLVIDVKTYGKENDEFWENYARRQLHALDVSEEQAKEWAPLVHAHLAENYNPEDVIPEDVLPTLSVLREANLAIGLVTNRSNPVDEYLSETGLIDHIDFYFAAGEIGAWKPDPAIFYYGLGLANAKPQDAVYVGDNYYADVVGAKNAKIQPILIDPQGVFPDADCPVIHTIGELQGLLVGEPSS